VCANNTSTVKVVTPDWILDCVESKTCKDERCYHPRLLSVPTTDTNVVPEMNVSNLHKGVASLCLTAAGQQQDSLTVANDGTDSTCQPHLTLDNIPKQSNKSSKKKSAAKFRPVSDTSVVFSDTCLQSMVADNAIRQVKLQSPIQGRGHLKNIANNTEAVTRVSKSGKAATSAKVSFKGIRFSKLF